MWHANTEKRKTTNDGRNSTKKSRKNQKGNFQILGNIGREHHQTWEDEIKKIQKYLNRTRKLFETKLYSRNLIKETNTRPVLLVRFSGPLLKWTKEELLETNQRTWKFITMRKALHPRDDVHRHYAARNEGGRRLTSIHGSVDASLERLDNCIKGRRGRPIRATIQTIQASTKQQ